MCACVWIVAHKAAKKVGIVGVGGPVLDWTVSDAARTAHVVVSKPLHLYLRLVIPTDWRFPQHG